MSSSEEVQQKVQKFLLKAVADAIDSIKLTDEQKEMPRAIHVTPEAVAERLIALPKVEDGNEHGYVVDAVSVYHDQQHYQLVVGIKERDGHSLGVYIVSPVVGCSKTGKWDEGIIMFFWQDAVVMQCEMPKQTILW